MRSWESPEDDAIARGVAEREAPVDPRRCPLHDQNPCRWCPPWPPVVERRSVVRRAADYFGIGPEGDAA